MAELNPHFATETDIIPLVFALPQRNSADSEICVGVTAEAPTDVTGPIIFALPSVGPTCIACDANGKVFASELENLVEGDLDTAEPHDVRQVWIASRVAGTEEIGFKGHHGRYGMLIFCEFYDGWLMLLAI